MLTEILEHFTTPANNLTEDGCILYPDQCLFLCKISILSLMSSLYAVYKEQYELAFIPFGVFLTSLMYWHKPTNCWRKTLDITYVKIALIYNMIRAYNSEYYIYYYITAFISLCFYPLGIYLYNKKLYWESTYVHSMVHIIANISNIILYSGYVMPFTDYFDYFGNPLENTTILDCATIINNQ
jgi:hypothetical protein